MPDGDTNETSNAPVQDINETGASSVSQSTDNLLSNLDNVTDSVTKLSKHVDSISTIATYTHTAVNESKNDIKNLSSIVDNNKTVTQQKIIEIIQDINELKNTRNNSDNTSNTEISSKTNTKIQEDNDDNEQKNRDEQLDNNQQNEQKDDNDDKSDVDEKKQFMVKVARMVIAMLPSSITNQNSPKSKLDEKTYNVRIKSFSPIANKQLIDNLKKTLKIEKRKESFVTKSNIIKLAILAFTGMLIYLIARIMSLKQAFSDWITNIYDHIISIKDNIVEFFKEQLANLDEMVITPISNTIANVANKCVELYEKIKEPLSKIFDQFGNVKEKMIEAWNYIKTLSFTDIMKKMFSGAINALKKAVNSVLHFNVFDIEKEEPQGESPSDETNAQSNDSGKVTVNPASTPQNNTGIASQDPLTKNTNTITNNNTSVNNQQAIIKDGDTTLGGSILKLQNGMTFNLHKNDDIYIANKPGGVIHGIFEEINSNYTNVKNIFIDNFNTIISNISNQDQTFSNLIEKLNNTSTPDMTIDMANNIRAIQEQVNILSQNSTAQPITYKGVAAMRREFRKQLI